MKSHHAYKYDYIYEENYLNAGVEASLLCGELRHGKHLGDRETISEQAT